MTNPLPAPKVQPIKPPEPLTLKPPTPPRPPVQATPDKAPTPPKPPVAEAPKGPGPTPKQAALPDAYHAVLRLPEYLAQLVRDRTGYPSRDTPQATSDVIRPGRERWQR